jgi:hypothetical protein
MSFLPGHVEMVFTSADEDNPLTTTTPEVGKIKLTPYTSDSTGVSIDAIPLLRGVQDSITRGDLVLYTNIGGQNFYLGPINTRNIPSNSSDHMYGAISTGKDRPDGYNRFISNLVYDKLSKPRNPQMDFPAIYNSINTNSVSYLESTVSDLMLEGRTGNAIRIGNRYDNPLIILSNNNSNDRETLGGGGSIFAMTSIGTIDNNFPTEVHTEIENTEAVLKPGYRLSADSDGYNIARGNDIVNEEKPESQFNYNYGFIKDYNPEELTPNDEFDQIIISSDRIIFNSTVEDITVSANRNINIGSNKNLTINNKGFSVFQSPNIYIGEAAKQRVQPMVLGDQLQKLLVRILRLLGDAQALGDMNVPQKLTLFPSIHIAGTLSQEVDNIMQEFNLGTLEPGQNPVPEYNKNLNDDGTAISDTITGQASFLSNRHFIEPNKVEVETQGPPPPPQE